MICQTIKIGTDCAFMGKNGCGYNGGSCHVIIDKCEECSKVFDLENGKYCRVYPDPASKWIYGNCPTASHLKRVIAEPTQKLNPLKASKRSKKH